MNKLLTIFFSATIFYQTGSLAQGVSERVELSAIDRQARGSTHYYRFPMSGKFPATAVCNWLVMEEDDFTNNGAIWPQAAGRIIGLPSNVDVAVGKISAYPFLVYVASLQDRKTCEAIVSILPPNDIGIPLSNEHAEAVRRSRTSNVCRLDSFDSSPVC